MKRRLLAGLFLTTLLSSATFAGDYTLLMYGANVFEGGEFTINSYLSNSGDEVLAYSFGVCFDETVIELVDLELLTPTPDFVEFEQYSGGWTVNVIVGAGPGLGLMPLPISEVHFLVTASYLAIGDEQTTTAVEFCVGPAPQMVPIALDTVSGPATPALFGGEVEIFDPLGFLFTIEDRDVYYSTNDPERFFETQFTLSEPDPGYDGPVQGFSAGGVHDPDFLELMFGAPMGPISYLGGSLLPPSLEFFQFDITSDGWSVGVIMGGFQFVEFDATLEPVIRMKYRVKPALLTGQTEVTTLAFSEDQGSPFPVPLAATFAGGMSSSAISIDGVVTLLPFDGDLFNRGDCNVDGALDVADGVTILSELFAGGSTPTCRAACDTNGDGIYDIADPVSLFNYMLLGAAPPPLPFGNCGGDDLGWSCDLFDACPAG